MSYFDDLFKDIFPKLASSVFNKVSSAVWGKASLPDEFTNIAKPAVENMVLTAIKDFISDKPAKKSGLELLRRNVYDSSSDGYQTYGEQIPIVYGTVKVRGRIIYSTPIIHTAYKDHDNNKTICKSTVSFLVAICSGSISTLNRIWVNGQQLELNYEGFRLYRGTEDQMPDPLVEKAVGKDMAPAYRGLAYAVFESVDIGDNQSGIPVFEFEVYRGPEYNETENDVLSLEGMIKSIVLIPGSGEFVYDTKIQYKYYSDYIEDTSNRVGQENTRGARSSINHHTIYKASNLNVALDNMQAVLPNIQWIAPVVGWYTCSTKVKECIIEPGVEYTSDATTWPSIWKVGEYIRKNAHLITQVDNSPIYGGTPSDESVVNMLKELKARGYNIMFYPMLFVDKLEKPWRGRITGDAADVNSFFYGTKGYNNFILHYAKLVAGLVDAFIIGSEMVGLNAIYEDSVGRSFPAVEALIDLAKNVRAILGNDVKITYAADWSEYHHTKDGWYHLDKLWASNDIDFIGIDAYFPLTDSLEQQKVAQIMEGWQRGEGCDYCYTDDAKTSRAAISPQYAWKNIEWWWSNEHINPDGNKTAWVPKSKKIWFTEYGFPSVDHATNQPNVFWSHDSIESKLPNGSKGYVDIMAQRRGIEATERFWLGSEIVERMFLWTWDARPFPTWPARKDLWSDSICWEKGHWVQGKLGMVSLKWVLLDLCSKVAISKDLIEFHDIDEAVDGFVVTMISLADVIELLEHAYFFHTNAIDGKIVFRANKSRIKHEIKYEELIIKKIGDTALEEVRTSDAKAYDKIYLNYIDRYSDYLMNTECYSDYESVSRSSTTIVLPIVTNAIHAKQVVRAYLLYKKMSCNQYNMILPPEYMAINVNDMLSVNSNHNNAFNMQVISKTVNNSMCVEISAIAVNDAIYDVPEIVSGFIGAHALVDEDPELNMAVLDMPRVNHEIYDLADERLMIAVCCDVKTWHGAKLYGDIAQSESMEYICDVQNSTIIGKILGKIWPCYNSTIMDRSSRIYVNLYCGELSSVTYEELAAGSNTAIVGGEIIQFATARLVKPYQYELSDILRGRFGTEAAIDVHEEGEEFVLLDQNLVSVTMPKNSAGQRFAFRLVPISKKDDQLLYEYAITRQIDYNANVLRPYLPVHVSYALAEQGLQISWIKRTRVVGRSNNFWMQDKDMAENRSIIYQIVITNKIGSEFTFETAGNMYLIEGELLSKIFAQSSAIDAEQKPMTGLANNMLNDLTITVHCI